MSFNKFLVLIVFVAVLRDVISVVINKCCDTNEILGEQRTCAQNPEIDSKHSSQNQLIFKNIGSKFNYTLKHYNPCIDSNYSMVPYSAFTMSNIDGTLKLKGENTMKNFEVHEESFCLESYATESFETYVMFCPCLEHDCYTNEKEENETLTLYFCDPLENPRPTFNLTSVITISHNYIIMKKQLNCKYETYQFLVGNETIDDEVLVDYIVSDYDTNCINYDDHEPNKFVIRICGSVNNQSYDILYYTFIFIESIITILIIILHLWLPELDTIYGKCLIFHLASSFVAKVIFASFHFVSSFGNLKVALGLSRFIPGLIIYYFAFASFCWMNVMCFDMAYTFSGKTRTIRSKSFEGKRQSKLRYYSLYSWGVPVLFTIIISIMEWTLPSASPFNPNFGSYYWFAPDKKMNTIFYYAPLCFQLGSNIIFFGFVIYRIILLSRGTEILHTSESGTSKQGEPKLSRKRVILFLKIFVVMGITWTIKLLPWLVTVTTLYNVVISSLDCLRSLCIFILFCCNRKVWKGIQKKLRETKIWKYFVIEDSQPTTAPNSSGTTTSSLSNRSNYKDNIEMTMKSD